MAPSVRALIRNTLFDRVPGLLRKARPGTKRVALTFDDGPDDMTPRYLQLLDELDVPATFFLLGELADKRPDLVRDYIRHGHQLAGHGYDHKRFSKLSRRDLIDQCRRTDQALGGQATGRSWVRPPHGTLDAQSLITLRAAGYVVALWTIDSLDHSDRDPIAIAERCGSAAVDGDVILLHEGQEWTLEALPRIVAALTASGLECVTMHDLFAR